MRLASERRPFGLRSVSGSARASGATAVGHTDIRRKTPRLPHEPSAQELAFGLRPLSTGGAIAMERTSD